jgi:hypothetical protein
MKCRNGAAWGVTLTWICLSAAGVSAQAPWTTPFEYATTPAAPMTPLPEAGPLLVTVPPATQESLRSGWGANLLLGLPTGVRLQKELDSGPDPAFVLEGFVGLFVVLPTVGGGIRYRCSPIQGRTDCLFLSPGVDAYVLFYPSHRESDGWFSDNPPNEFGPQVFGLVSVDVDCAWQHRFGRHADGELGVKLGGGVSLSQPSGFLPLVGIYGGIRY